jgi:hypothetical protein
VCALRASGIPCSTEALLSEFGRYEAICVDSLYDKFILDSLFALAFQSKTSPVRQKVAREELGWGAAWGMSGHSQRDFIG